MIHAAPPRFDVAHLLGRSLDLHRSGDLGSAQLGYVQILGISPRHFDALHLLGVVRHQQGRHDEAHALIASALEVGPDCAEALSNLGIVLQALGRNDEAVAAYDRALDLKPRSAEALNNRGTALRAMNRPAAAVMSFDRAIAIRPDYADAHFNRADLLTDLGRLDEAIASYDQAIALRPDHFDSYRARARALQAVGKFAAALSSLSQAAALHPDDADLRLERGVALSRLDRHHEALAEYEQVLHEQPGRIAALVGRGACLSALDRLEEAEASFRRAIALSPDQADAHAHLGRTLIRRGHFEEALASLEQARLSRPHDSDILNARGDALYGLQRHHDAVESYNQALAIVPVNAVFLNNRAAALNELGMHLDAVTSLDAAIVLDPNYAEAYCNRGDAFTGLNDLVEARANYETALGLGTPPPLAFSGYADCAARLCDWSRTAQVQHELESRIVGRLSIVSPSTLLAYDASPALRLACAKIYHAERCPPPPMPPHHARRRNRDRMHIAYLSGHFTGATMPSANLVERHDRSRFQITGVSLGRNDGSEIRAGVAEAFDVFHDLRGARDIEAAERLRELNIDIVVDLGCGDRGPGVLAYRPAPLQVNYLGHPGTLGCDFIDYIIADPVVAPPGDDRFHVEKIARLPYCYQVCDTRSAVAERVPARKDAGLPDRGVVLCGFNDSRNISAAVFDVWMRLLAALPDSVLWLLRDHPEAELNLRRYAASRGVDPARLVFAARTEPAEQSARYRIADLFLDTLPCNAHAFCSDALWAGLPVLTCRGDSFAGRVSASLLHAVGLPELVTPSLEDYAELALWLAEDVTLLREIRKRLAENRLSSPLFEPELTVRHLEAAFTLMRRLSHRGEPPRSFQIEPCDDFESPIGAAGS